MLKYSEQKTKMKNIRAKIREKCILFGIIPPPQAAQVSGDHRQLSDEQRDALRALLDYAHQRRAQFHR